LGPARSAAVLHASPGLLADRPQRAERDILWPTERMHVLRSLAWFLESVGPGIGPMSRPAVGGPLWRLTVFSLWHQVCAGHRRPGRPGWAG